MLNSSLSLSEKIFADDIPQKSTRDGFGTGTVAAGKEDERVVVLSADLKESTRAEWFEKEFPDRFIEVGVAEQNLATLAAGMAAAGKIPFITSYAAFSPGRNYEQIRTTAALNEMPVKVMGMHAGVSVGPDGATHQMLEDVGMMRMLPHMTVLVPADAEEAHKAVVAAAKHPGPVYIRFGRSASPVFTTASTPFVIGKALTLWESEKPQIAFIASGPLAYEALLAAKQLEAEGVGSIVLNLGSVKPLDEEAVLDAARKAGKVIVVEEHQAAGGVGGAIAELLAQKLPTPMRFAALHDTFGQSGDPQELLAHYGLTAPGIIALTRSFI